jgi:hypothetical protein
MTKYQLLFLLNIPFVLFGLARIIIALKKGETRTVGIIVRTSFWIVILVGLLFSENIYNFLVMNGLTDSTPLSIADVILVTGINLCFALILRLYTKIEKQERRFVDLHESISIKLSDEPEK